MKQTSTKHTNKNTIRSGKTINSSNFDVDDYLSDLNEPDEPVSKTSSSKHDGTITPKSKTVIAPTSTGKSLHVLNQDGQRANKAQRLTKAVAGKPSTTSAKQQRKPGRMKGGGIEFGHVEDGSAVPETFFPGSNSNKRYNFNNPAGHRTSVAMQG